jgi:hypothetical protein
LIAGIGRLNHQATQRPNTKHSLRHRERTARPDMRIQYLDRHRRYDLCDTGAAFKHRTLSPVHGRERNRDYFAERISTAAADA